jgi:hypothetical protein
MRIIDNNNARLDITAPTGTIAENGVVEIAAPKRTITGLLSAAALSVVSKLDLKVTLNGMVGKAHKVEFSSDVSEADIRTALNLVN